MNENPHSKAKFLQVAVIRESECIGCTKCIQACPFDAIIGASKQMHTVLSDICTGCELCIEPCPVDCIDLAPVERTAEELKKITLISQERHDKHQTRPKENLEEEVEIPSLEDRKKLIAQILKNKT